MISYKKKNILITLVSLIMVFVLCSCTLKEVREYEGTDTDITKIEEAKPTKKAEPTDEPEPTEEIKPTEEVKPTEVPTDAPVETPAEWNPDIRFKTSDFDMFNWDDSCFANAKVTMINLWAYWCGPCVGEIPEIIQLSKDYADKGVQIFGITYPEEEAENRATAKDLEITYPILFYTSDFDEYLDSGYLPTTIFVDENGHVLGEPLIGSRSYSEWAEYIDEYLAK